MVKRRATIVKKGVISLKEILNLVLLQNKSTPFNIGKANL